MSIPDSLILDYFELVTDAPEEEIAEFKERLETRSINPMDLKKRLAHEIVRQFHAKQAADEAEEYFQERFQTRELHKIEVTGSVSIKGSVEVVLTRDMPRWLVASKLADSISEARRLLAQGAVQIIRADGTRQVVKDENVEIKPGDRIRVGKLRFAEIVQVDEEKT